LDSRFNSSYKLSLSTWTLANIAAFIKSWWTKSSFFKLK
jgi:hypothetical protein